MSAQDLFIKLAQRGTQLKISRAEVDPLALAAQLSYLRSLGHAVVADETFDHRGVSLGLTVIHYLTCTKCKGD